MHIFKALTLSLSLVLPGLGALSATPIPNDAKTNGFAIGVQAYTFHKKLSAWESVEKAAEAGAKVIEFYPGQRFSKEDKSRLDHDTPPEKIAALKGHLAKLGVRAVNYGVVDIPKDEKKARKIFELAKALDLYAITTESTGSIDTIEKLVKEFDIRVGYHNHPRNNRPSYKVWDAKYIRDLVAKRDKRIGAAADIGHWTTDKFNAVENLKILEGRIISVHAKDRKVAGRPVRNVPLGQGVIGVGAVLAELKRQGFEGNISIEHEDDWDNNVPQVKAGIEFVRDFKGDVNAAAAKAN
jgi:sugar phosphate isomerase/epimerase